MVVENNTVVDPDNGLGTTYLDLDGWEDDYGNVASGDCVGQDQIALATCRCTGGTPDTVTCTIDGWLSTDPTRYIKAWTNPAEGYRNTLRKYQTGNKYRMEKTNALILRPKEQNCRIEGLQFKGTFTLGGVGAIVDFQAGSNGGGTHYLSDCIIVGVASGSPSDAKYGVRVGGNHGHLNMWNNIVYGINHPDITGICVRAIDKLYAYNNTFYDADYGIYDDGGNVIAKNNVFRNCDVHMFNISSGTHNVVDVESSGAAWGEIWSSGITNSVATNKLIDNGATFQTDGVQIGSVIRNTTDFTYTYVTVIDSETTLSIANDIFASGEIYSVYTNMFGTITFIDENNDDFGLDTDDTAATDKGKNLSNDSRLSFTDDIHDNERITPWDAGAYENIKLAGMFMFF
jgi:hypothetical protein